MELQEDIQDIIVMHLTGEISSEQEKKFQSWLSESPQHQKLYEEFSSIWYAGRWEPKLASIDCEKGWNRLVKKHQKRKLIQLFPRVAVAASIVLALTLFCLYRPSEEIAQVAQNQTVWEKAEVILVLSSGDSVNVKNSSISEISEESSMIHADSCSLRYSENEENVEHELVYNELIVPKCGEYRLCLSDGSQVVLNSESRLRYPVNFAKNRREVYLEGEACFDVVKDSLSPFIVHTARTKVEVLGTLFNLSSYEQDGNTTVTLVNGRVRVCIDSTFRLLQPNEKLELCHSTSEIEVRTVFAPNEIAWTRGWFSFDAMPLSQLMKELERWYDISYEFKDLALGEFCFTGGFSKCDDIRHIVKMMNEISEVSFTIVNNMVLIDKK